MGKQRRVRLAANKEREALNGAEQEGISSGAVPVPRLGYGYVLPSLLVVLLGAAVLAAAAQEATPFPDVPPDAYYAEPVSTLAAVGVFVGTECDEGFCPEEDIDRVTVAVWAVRVLDGADPPRVASTRFGDVAGTHPFAAFVERLAVLGVTQGCGDGSDFCPDRTVTRAQMAAFLARAFGLAAGPDPGFSDVPSGAWYAASVARLAASGITKGCGDGTMFCPDRAVTRAQMATFLARALEFANERSGGGEGSGGGGSGGGGGGGSGGGGGGGGSTLSQRQVQAPGAPQSVVMAVRGDTTLEVLWDSPHSDGGDSNLSYVVQRRPGALGIWSSTRVTVTPSESGTGHRAEMEGLVNGVTYQIRVAARNSGGTGSFVVVEGQPVGTRAPGDPTSLSVRAGRNQLSVSWRAPSDRGGYASVTYEVQYRVADTGGWTTFATDETGTSVTITGLDNGVEYQVRVAARNPVLSSRYVEGTGTPTGSGPSVPRFVSVTAEFERLSVSWQEPEDPGGYDLSLLSYSVLYRESGGGAWTTFASDETGISVTITGLDNGVEYQVQVAARNPAGSSGSITRAGTPVGNLPGAPTIDTVTAGNRSLEVEWSAPSNTGGYADSFLTYSVQYRKGSSGSFTTFASGVTGTSVTITGLDNGDEYEVQVEAVNPAGASGYTTSARGTPVGIAPGKPGSVSLIAGNGSLRVDWQKPSTGGYADSFLTYSVQYRKGSSGSFTTFASGVTGTSVTITGLDNGDEYEVQVEAVNPAGASGYTTSARGTPVGTKPEAPTGVSVTAGRNQMSVSWTAPSVTGGYNASDLTYSVQYRKGSTGGWTTFASAETATSVTITGLDNGYEYQVQIAARNPGNFVSTYSDPESATPVGDAPDKPTNVSVTVGKNRLSVSWNAPSGTGGYASSFLTYTVEFREGSTGQWSTDGVNVSGRSATITGLDNGVEYEVQVEAVNPAGGSGFTDPQSGTPRGDRPGTPTIDGVRAGNGSLEVSWTAPTDTGDYASSFLAYVVQYRKGSSGSFTTYASDETGTSVTITGLDNGDEYQVQVATKNPAGTSGYVTATETPVGTAPDAPTIDTVRAGNGSLEVSWTAPTDTGDYASSFLAYVVQYRKGSSGSFTTYASDETGTSVTITGLDNGDEYQVQVATKNPAGTSGFDTATGTPVGTMPGKPGSLSAQARNAALLVSWAAPSNLGGYDASFLTYSVQYREGSSGSFTTFASDETGTSVTITGLDNGTEYEVQVEAKNPAGSSGYTTPVKGTPVGTEPSAVRNPAVTSDGDGELDVSWDAPDDHGGYSTLTYVVERRKAAGNRSWSDAGVTISGTTATITGLDVGEEYDVQVAATNGAGTGPYEELSGTPEGSLPGAPGNLMVTAGSRQLSLSWDAADDGGYDSVSYVVEYRTGTDEWSVFAESNSTDTAAVITGLVNGTSYDVRVAATNVRGRGPDTASTGTPVGTVPGAPRHVAARPGHESLEITWSVPASTGGYGAATLTYTVEFKESGSTDDWSDTGVTVTGTAAEITGLTNDTAYQVRVGASNAAGTGTQYGTVTATPAKSFKPRDVVVTGGGRSLVVTWSAPAAPAGEITTYDIRYRQDGTDTWTTVSSVTSPHTISSLMANTSYDVQVGTNDTSANPTVWSDTVTRSTRAAPGRPWGLKSQAQLTETKLHIRWSIPTSGVITGYKIQWRRDGDDWDPSRRQTTKRYPTSPANVLDAEINVGSAKDNDGDGTEWQIRIMAYNNGGDSEPIEIDYTQLHTVAEYNAWAEDNIIEPLEEDWPWLRAVWDFLDSRPGANLKVANTSSYQGRTRLNLIRDPRAANDNLPVSTLTDVSMRKALRREDPEHLSAFIHELAHVYAQTTDIADWIDDVALIGMVYLYVNEEYENSPFDAECVAHELMADMIQYVVMKDADADAENGDLSSLFNLPASAHQYLEYWLLCNHVGSSPTSDDETFIRSVLEGDIPDWFTDTYGGSSSDIYTRDYDGDAAEVWKHLRRFQASDSQTALSYRVVPVNYLSKLFGGYCSNSGATNEARNKGTPTEGRNPWANDGCPLTNTGSIALTSGASYIEVDWDNTRSINTDFVDEIQIQWKSSGQEYSDVAAEGRNTAVTQSQLPYRITTTAGTQLSVRIRLVSGDNTSPWVEGQATAGS